MFTRNSVQALRTKLQEKLNAIAEEFDVALKLGNASFTDNNITFKLEVASLDEKGEAVSATAETFKRMASVYGLDPNDLNKTFDFGHKTYKIVGLKTRRSKYPVLCEANGKLYKFPASAVKSLLVKNAPAGYTFDPEEN